MCKFESYSYLQSPDGVVCKDLLFGEGDLEGSKGSATRVWPVLLTLLLVALLQVGHHDDGGGSLLPHQPPKINQNMLFWSCRPNGFGFNNLTAGTILMPIP